MAGRKKQVGSAWQEVCSERAWRRRVPKDMLVWDKVGLIEGIFWWERAWRRVPKDMLVWNKTEFIEGIF